MPWKVCATEDAKRRFIQDWLDRKHASFVTLCQGYGISRGCGYKWLRRFKEGGRKGLRERSRQPHQTAQRQAVWQGRLRLARLQERDFGAKKLHWKLRQDHPRQRVPCVRTLARWLHALGQVRPRVRRAPAGPAVRLAGRLQARCANDVWTADFKGTFSTRDGRRVQALTVRDLATRWVLCTRHVARANADGVGRVLRGLFRRYGLPRAIRTDNGPPFGSDGPRGWSRLSVQWIKLGIRLEHGRPRHPEDNPHHEQLHRVLKRATARPAAPNLAAQQKRFDRWRQRYNARRPHEGLAQTVPAARYRPSPRCYPDQRTIYSYPAGWTRLQADAKGRCDWGHRQRLIGRAFAHEQLAGRPAAPGVLAVYFQRYLIGTLHATDLAGLRPVRCQLHSTQEREGLRPSLHPPSSI